MTFGQRLRELRDVCELRQEDVSRKVGISVSLYCGYEKDRVEPTLSKLRRLAEFYDVTLDDLAGG